MAECGTCDRWFRSEHAARQHMSAVGHTFECDFCDLAYYYQHHLENHQDDERHMWECDFCSDEFYKERDLEEHQDDYGHHGRRYECEACYVWYDNYPQIKSHMNREGHWRVHWCDDCERGFENDNNLKAVRISIFMLR